MNEVKTFVPCAGIEPEAEKGPISMNAHRHYGKIQRLGKEETEGILEGLCHIQEKVDGANTSIWRGENHSLLMGSRTRILGNEDFNGFVSFVRSHAGIVGYTTANPHHRLYGEWLVRHTIAYKETAYRKWYLFDIWDEDSQKFLTTKEVAQIGIEFEIDTVPMLADIENPTLEQIKEYVGKSAFGDRGEGVVIKNLSFKNKFGDCVFAKIVTESFKEDNAVTFGGNNKHSDVYNEVRVVNKYMTLPRVRKIMEKLQPEVNERLDMKHIPRIMNTAYHDMMTEEIWDIIKEVPALDFKALHRIATKKARQIFVDILNDSISVADQNHV